MMSWVMRSPSCSQIRISRASSLRSGKSASISSSSRAARKMLPPASSKRSKNWRSRGARTLGRRTGRKLSGGGGEPGLFETARERVPPTLAPKIHDRPPVILGAPPLNASVVVEQRVGGAVVVVERQADAARVDELNALRRCALKLDVRVAEDDALGLDALDELRVLRARPVREADHVGAGRGVAEERAVAGRLLLQ